MFIKGKDRQFEIIGRKRYWFAISGLLIIVAILGIATLGLNLGLEFKGGYQVRLLLDQPATVTEINDIVGTFPDFSGKSVVQTTNDNKTVIIKLPTVDNETALVGQLQSAVEAKYGFTQTPEQEQVGSEWGREVSQKAIISLAVFLGLILIYISLRFEFKMAVTGIVALIHDTIVVFDRVNENVGLLGSSTRQTYGQMVNESVNETLVRSINTTLTTLIPITAILVFGGSTLKDFAFALFIGVFLGAYSSVFLASPLLAVWKEREPRYEAVKVKAGAGQAARDAILRKKEVKGGESVKAAVKPSAKAKAVPPKEKAEQAKAMHTAKPKPGAGTQKGEPGKKTPPKGQKKTTKGPQSKKKKKKKKKR